MPLESLLAGRLNTVARIFTCLEGGKLVQVRYDRGSQGFTPTV